ncbi:MAG: type II toxin-antitoxin system RelE/ParE family toxin [Acidobacteria bacterium]|nr:type II toxin-antitoxin system RelE/ParE family toxin [Acidobacteriota bacterium]MCY4634056.1 type II toxin-antitoxin system RelE/ParE family toxin [Acidobacteriota bacterium]
MNYSVRIKRSAARELARIPEPERRRIVRAIDDLRERPLRGSVLKGELLGLRRVRVGDHRIVYEILHEVLVVLVVRVAHRREVYRRR